LWPQNIVSFVNNIIGIFLQLISSSHNRTHMMAFCVLIWNITTYLMTSLGCKFQKLILCNVILEHPVALHRSDVALCFYAIYVQLLLLLFTCHFFFIDTTCFGLTGHLQVYRLLWLRNLLLTVKLLCFSYVVASDYIWLCGITTNDCDGRPQHKILPPQQEHWRQPQPINPTKP
jgi:hypothetical protein